MKRNLPIPAAALLLALTMGAAANLLPAGKDTDDIMVGVTGISGVSPRIATKVD